MGFLFSGADESELGAGHGGADKDEEGVFFEINRRMPQHGIFIGRRGAGAGDLLFRNAIEKFVVGFGIADDEQRAGGGFGLAGNRSLQRDDAASKMFANGLVFGWVWCRRLRFVPDGGHGN